MKKLIVFDLDGTLNESKSPLDAEMAALFTDLLKVTRVAVISGGNWSRFELQLLSQLPQNARLENLLLLPTCGTRFHRFTGTWELLYAEDLTADEKTRVKEAFRQALTETSYAADRTWGEIIEDRGSQLTFSALGQGAPLAAKRAWDPDFKKRNAIKSSLERRIPGFSIHVAGMTSVDVTRLGIDKGYGIRKLRDILGIAIPDMLFVGDALFPGGNDYPAKEAGAPSIQVKNPEETKRLIEKIIAG